VPPRTDPRPRGPRIRTSPKPPTVAVSPSRPCTTTRRSVWSPPPAGTARSAGSPRPGPACP